MAQKKNKSSKKPTSKQPIKGSGGLLGTRKWNWKYSLIVVIVVALAGGAWVWKSNATSNIVLTRLAGRGLMGGTIKKTTSGMYLVNSTGVVRARVSYQDSQIVSKVCAHLKATQAVQVSTGISYSQAGGAGPAVKTKAGGVYTICQKTVKNYGEFTFIISAPKNSIMVDRVYAEK
mgnify:CR=1 FL=1|jgi:hypothetical protein